MDDMTLGIRKGMPQDLLFLTEKHPRDSWRAHHGLAGTGEIWLANHDHFRDLTGRIAAGLNALRETGETTYDSGPALQRKIQTLLTGLDGHHRIEDHHYFPIFQQVEPRLIRCFEILDADHHMIHDAIDELAAATTDSLRRLGSSEGVMTSDQRHAVDDLARVVARVNPILRQHLADEEDIVIPLILERARSDPEFG